MKRDTAESIKEKIRRLKTRAGHEKLLSDPLYPSKEKENDRQTAERYAVVLDGRLKELEPLIRSLKSHIGFIGDNDKYVASYLLIGKSYTNLKAISLLVRNGYASQILELVRSGMESLYLVATFLEDGQEKLVSTWFEGKLVPNSVSREILDKASNEARKKKAAGGIPMKEALAYTYSIYSAYTHSTYIALFDFIDVFNEDFDFEQNAQFHYNKINLNNIDHLYINILLGLKNFYIRTHDEANLAKVESLLAKDRSAFATPEEIDKTLRLFNE